MILTRAEIGVIRHIARKKPTAALHLLEYMLDRLEAEPPAASANLPSDDKHPDTVRLDWLNTKRPDLEEDNDNKFKLVGVGCFQTFADLRELIDAAMKESR